MIFQGQHQAFESWLLYLELVLVSSCGAVWLYKLSECLMLYDPLLIIPLMVRMHASTPPGRAAARAGRSTAEHATL